MKKLGFLSLGIGIVCAATPAAWSNPTGGVIRNGSATIVEGIGVVSVNQASNKAIIDWETFSIEAGELTNFNQPASGATLNRVVSANPSSILGQLNATGDVILINPNGIVVGPSGRVDAASFIASTLNVSDAEFLAGGDLRFSGDSVNGVTNLGTIVAREGDLFLLGTSVNNTGSLSAPNGTVGLAAGRQILVKATGDERVFVEVGSGGKVEHSGSIQAAVAELKAAGVDPNTLAVSVNGVVEATGVQRVGGRVYLSGGGGKVFIDAPVSAKPAPESDPISGTRIDIKGGDIEIRGADVNAYGPGEAELLVDASGDVLIVDSLIGTMGATSGEVVIETEGDLEIRSENERSGIGQFDGPIDPDVEFRIFANSVVIEDYLSPYIFSGPDPGIIGHPDPSITSYRPVGGDIVVVGFQGGNVVLNGGDVGGGGVYQPIGSGGVVVGNGDLETHPGGSVLNSEVHRSEVSSQIVAVPSSPRISGDTLVERAPDLRLPAAFPRQIRAEVEGQASDMATGSQNAREKDNPGTGGSDSGAVKLPSGENRRVAGPEAFRRLFDPAGSRQFLETRIGGE